MELLFAVWYASCDNKTIRISVICGFHVIFSIISWFFDFKGLNVGWNVSMSSCFCRITRVRGITFYLQCFWVLIATIINASLVFADEDYADEDYLLGGGDTVNIAVYQQPDLTTTARISQDDGTIIFPLIGEVSVVGLSPEDAGRKIEKLLKDGGFLVSPQVSFKVTDFLSQKITVMGQVNNPGEYSLKGESRVADLVSQAGGLQQDAADTIIVVKKEDGKSVKHSIDLLRFYAGDMSQNIKVSRGDFVLVPKMDTFYIHGEVKRPGSFRLERDMTLMQALSVAGGITGRGSLKGVKVTRDQGDGQIKRLGWG